MNYLLNYKQIIDDYEAAYNLINFIQPQSTYENLLKAITSCSRGNEEQSVHNLIS